MNGSGTSGQVKPWGFLRHALIVVTPLILTVLCVLGSKLAPVDVALAYTYIFAACAFALAMALSMLAAMVLRNEQGKRACGSAALVMSGVIALFLALNTWNWWSLIR